ncbi:hypothetical protein M8818_004804 [Zalaria obscura]|uniref:Uncharacterized protein n=1 Tax=Zalaria obscura TaxID=2024903 RepID=A0ACC3SF10_9PEZI
MDASAVRHGGSRVSAMWQSSALLEAGSHAHLMHSLLGLSALHIAAHSGPQVQKWHKIKAYQHQTQALSTQRAALPNLSAENCVALCFTAVVLVHFELAVPFTSGFGNPVSTLQRLITISDLSRGHYSIFSSHDHIIRSGPMGAMINRNAWDDIIWELEPDVGAAFDTLEGLVDTYSHDESVASEYRCARGPRNLHRHRGDGRDHNLRVRRRQTYEQPVIRPKLA